MAIFSCINGDAHATRRKGTNRARGEIGGVADRAGTAGGIPENTRKSEDGTRLTSNGNEGATRVLKTTARPQSYNGQQPVRARSPRDLARASIKGTRLQKKARLSKEMIGRPKDFVHCTYVDKADAKVGFDTEEMQQAYRVMHDDSGGKPPTARLNGPSTATGGKTSSADSFAQSRQPAESECTTAPATTAPNTQRDSTDSSSADVAKKRAGTPVSQAKRKAPPPVTPSIIKAAGHEYTRSLSTKNQGHPNVPGSRDQSVQPRETESQAPQSGRPDSLDKVLGTVAADGVSLSASAEALAPTVIITVTPKAQKGEEISSMSALPTYDKDQSSLEHQPPSEGYNAGSTAEKTASPTVHGDRGLNGTSHQPGAASLAKTTGPLEYMTASTKAKWDGEMEEIAKQLREEGDEEENGEDKGRVHDNGAALQLQRASIDTYATALASPREL